MRKGVDKWKVLRTVWHIINDQYIRIIIIIMNIIEEASGHGKMNTN